MKIEYRHAKILALLIGFQLVSGLVMADENSENNEYSNTLEEILVTAEKRAQNLQDVPVSVSAFTGDAIEKLQMHTAAEIASQVPNLQVSAPYGEIQPIFSIRGISMVDYNTNQASPIGVYVDEVFTGPAFMQGMQLYDLERVEVLRGPQGTLYGKNTTGGAINFITRAPSFQREAEFTLSLGNYSRRQIKGAVEMPLIEDALGMRFAFTAINVDAYHKNHWPGSQDLSETDNYALRLSTRYQGENFDATLRIHKAKSDPNSLAIVPIGTDPGGVNRLGYLRPAEFDSWEGEHDRIGPIYKAEIEGIALNMNWSLGDYSLTSITGYSQGEALNQSDTDGSPVRVLDIDFGSDAEVFTQDLRLTSNFDGRFNFIAGFYYSNDSLEADNKFDVLLGTEDLGIPFDPYLVNSGLYIGQAYLQKRESYAAYSHFTFDLSESTSLIVGLRYTWDEGQFKNVAAYAGDYDRNPVMGLIPFTLPYDPTAVMDTKYFDDSEPTGKLGIDHKFGENTLLYASYSRGYRSSAFNGGAIFSEDDANIVAPEIVDSFEVGLKTRVWDNRLQINSAVFYSDYSDQQFIEVFGINQTLQNAGSSKIYGMEVEMTALLNDNLSMLAGLGLVHTEFTTLMLNDPFGTTKKDYSGNELQQAPKVNFNIALDWVVGRWKAGELGLYLATTYQDDQFFSAYNDSPGFENIRSGSFWQSSVLLHFDDAADRYTIALWAKNLENNDEPIYALSLSGGYGYDYTVVGAPRTYGVDFTYRF
jgi:iron complex outermembrane receptor protein